MYSSFQLAKKYFRYYIHAKNGRGHGIHSPFVFDFVTHVLNASGSHNCYDVIEHFRTALLRDDGIIEVEDFGAGSAVLPKAGRKVKSIAKSSLKNKKFARLLFRLIEYYQPRTIIELGTSFGITTCYLACAGQQSTVYTFEGSTAVASIAAQHFKKAGFENIRLVEGNFDVTLPGALTTIEHVDFAFIDGNHRKQATLDYFYLLLTKSTPGSIFIFDDIHWSAGMEEAWAHIQQHPSVTLTIDLFFIGLVFFNPAFKARQHFSIRF